MFISCLCSRGSLEQQHGTFKQIISTKYIWIGLKAQFRLANIAVLCYHVRPHKVSLSIQIWAYSGLVLLWLIRLHSDIFYLLDDAVSVCSCYGGFYQPFYHARVYTRGIITSLVCSPITLAFTLCAYISSSVRDTAQRNVRENITIWDKMGIYPVKCLQLFLETL